MKPTHKHDCNKCRLLLVTEEADWYHCPHEFHGGSIIGRYGRAGDYWSLDLVTIRQASDDCSRFMEIAKVVDKLYLEKVVTQ